MVRHPTCRVLDANPLDEITNTRRISAVVLCGAAVDRAQPVRSGSAYAPHHRSAGSLLPTAGRVDACASSHTIFAVDHLLRKRTWRASAAHTIDSSRSRRQVRPLSGPLPCSRAVLIGMYGIGRPPFGYY